MARKYQPLESYLRKLSIETKGITLTFDQIEHIIGDSLPDSAHNWRPWWGNQSNIRNRPQAAAWLSAGWKVDTVNQNNKWVRFKRG